MNDGLTSLAVAAATNKTWKGGSDLFSRTPYARSHASQVSLSGKKAEEEEKRRKKEGIYEEGE